MTDAPERYNWDGENMRQLVDMDPDCLWNVVKRQDYDAAIARAEAAEAERRDAMALFHGSDKAHRAVKDDDRVNRAEIARLKDVSKAFEADARSWRAVALSNQASAQSHCERWARAEAAVKTAREDALREAITALGRVGMYLMAQTIIYALIEKETK